MSLGTGIFIIVETIVVGFIIWGYAVLSKKNK